MPGNTETGDHLRSAVLLKRNDLLNYEELLRIVRLAVAMGMNKLRLTGGEPLVRRGVMDFIGELGEIDGLDEIRLTTNGVLLHDNAQQLYEAGVRNINISLDTMMPERFAEITGRDLYERVWQGIETAIETGFRIKLNVVAMRGINDDEFKAFGELALARPLQVRFIEFMPMGEKSTWEKKRFISAEEILACLAPLGELAAIGRSHLEGPARMYSLTAPDGRTGRVGVISPISHHFCDQCNRLRLTSEGKLRSCLLHNLESDLKELIRSGCSDEEIKGMIRETILKKPKGHTLADDLSQSDRPTCVGQMSQIGG